MSLFAAVLLLLASGSADARDTIATHPDVTSTVDLLERWIEARMIDRDIPGLAIAVVHGRNLLWSRGFGYADRESRAPVRPSTIFRIASITKTFTATAALILRDEGRLRLDDPVRDHLAWFRLRTRDPEDPPITVRHLLLHTAGLPREADFPYWTDHVFPTREQIIETLPGQDPVFSPETHYKYSNLGIAVLGEVVAAASGVPYETFIRDRILQPLQMTSTSVFLSADHRARLATGYGRRLADGTRTVSPATESAGLAPAANISSTAEDLARYAAFHLSEDSTAPGQPLRASTLREMHRLQWINPDWKSGRALGFGVRKTDDRVTVGHDGWVAGHRSSLLLSVQENLAVIVLINADDASPSLIASRALALLAPAVQAARRGPASPTPETWTRYTGTYRDPWGWQTDVLVYRGNLVLYDYGYPTEDDPAGSLTELTPAGDHTFRMGGGNGELAVFELADDGTVRRLKVGANYTYPERTP